MIFVLEGKRAVGARTVGKIRITACDENEVALEFAFFVEWAGAVDFRVEAIVGAEFCEQCAFSEELRSRSGDKKFVGVMRVDDFAGGQIQEFDAEIGTGKFWTIHDPLNARGERVLRARR